ncbi:uncharacterized protein B0H18DRAFT_1044800 [Fomitopsis serialis]|uniref:uncharacterized protein n=1 Tax=Fomitopsis serialis TaxID=139415 RepID=UPI0020077BC6|nr:uncharacterized protein B0H18DRAFT_1044800 [Neoantrodia serialis]KAH9914563.1 hypothetical protein B0H18DRAFT_1044800 [Neoantrodia serialis]
MVLVRHMKTTHLATALCSVHSPLPPFPGALESLLPTHASGLHRLSPIPLVPCSPPPAALAGAI